MKLFHISLLLLSTLLMTGCIGDNLDDCPPIITDNLTIGFLYPDDNGTDIFSQQVNKVNLFVYDQQNNYVTSQRIDQSSLSTFAGTKLQLNPGTYRIVCWGNADKHSEFLGINNGSLWKDAFLANSTIDANDVTPNGDPLHYAPKGGESADLRQSTAPGFYVTVPTQGTKEVTIDFTRAHIKVIVYIKGFEDFSAQGEFLTPFVELTNVPSRYNFDLETTGKLVTYRDVATQTTVEGNQVAVMVFDTPLFDQDTPINLVVKQQSDGKTLTTVSLADFIQENNIILGNSVVLELPIMLTYIQGKFEIGLPNWDKKPVEPGFN